MKDSTSTNQSVPEPQKNLLLIGGLPIACRNCGGALCLRKQVINLALGNEEQMFCLNCLGGQNGKTAEAVLLGIKDYIKGRDCFRKEWVKYESAADCPDRNGCHPHACFE